MPRKLDKFDVEAEREANAIKKVADYKKADGRRLRKQLTLTKRAIGKIDNKINSRYL